MFPQAPKADIIALCIQKAVLALVETSKPSTSVATSTKHTGMGQRPQTSVVS